ELVHDLFQSSYVSQRGVDGATITIVSSIFKIWLVRKQLGGQLNERLRFSGRSRFQDFWIYSVNSSNRCRHVMAKDGAIVDFNNELVVALMMLSFKLGMFLRIALALCKSCLRSGILPPRNWLQQLKSMVPRCLFCVRSHQ
ncbi:hypothetical protein HAX54_013180, partial [Datura stramonium]|nr:hypothetical protein [Datura stramonium]